MPSKVGRSNSESWRNVRLINESIFYILYLTYAQNLDLRVLSILQPQWISFPFCKCGRITISKVLVPFISPLDTTPTILTPPANPLTSRNRNNICSLILVSEEHLPLGLRGSCTPLDPLSIVPTCQHLFVLACQRRYDGEPLIIKRRLLKRYGPWPIHLIFRMACMLVSPDVNPSSSIAALQLVTPGLTEPSSLNLSSQDPRHLPATWYSGHPFYSLFCIPIRSLL